MYVVVLSIPHFRGLRTSDMLEFLIHDRYAEHYLPPKYDQIVLNREWIGNLCKCFCCSFSGNSIHPEAFHNYVESKMYSRQQKITKNKQLSLDVLPKFEQILKSSLMVSSKYLPTNK